MVAVVCCRYCTAYAQPNGLAVLSGPVLPGGSPRHRLLNTTQAGVVLSFLVRSFPCSLSFPILAVFTCILVRLTWAEGLQPSPALFLSNPSVVAQLSLDSTP